jgi:serine protease SohB
MKLETISEVMKIVFYLLAIGGAVLFLFKEPKLKIRKSNIEIESLNKKMFERAKSAITSIYGFRFKEGDFPYQSSNAKMFLIEFKGSLMADEIVGLKEEIDTILLIGQKNDEVVVKLESPGGAAPHYSYAAAQLERLKNKGFKLTVCVDVVAASGGYMMAAVADKIVASKDAIVGSIGVVSEFPNFSGSLKKLGISWKEYTAGEHKRTVGSFKEPSSKDEEHFKSKLHTVYKSFKEHIKKHRPQIDEEKVMNGDHWLAREALELQLVDEISTSDEYVWNHMKKFEILKIKYKPKRSLYSKLFKEAEASFENVITKILFQNNRYY